MIDQVNSGECTYTPTKVNITVMAGDLFMGTDMAYNSQLMDSGNEKFQIYLSMTFKWLHIINKPIDDFLSLCHLIG